MDMETYKLVHAILEFWSDVKMMYFATFKNGTKLNDLSKSLLNKYIA